MGFLIRGRISNCLRTAKWRLRHAAVSYRLVLVTRTRCSPASWARCRQPKERCFYVFWKKSLQIFHPVLFPYCRRLETFYCTLGHSHQLACHSLWSVDKWRHLNISHSQAYGVAPMCHSKRYLRLLTHPCMQSICLKRAFVWKQRCEMKNLWSEVNYGVSLRSRRVSQQMEGKIAPSLIGARFIYIRHLKKPLKGHSYAKVNV